jgi:ankyrin repeat protein
MESRELPLHPNLDQYKKQAKDLLKALQAEDPSAIQRIRQFHPHGRELSAPGFADTQSLADTQLVLAREHSFESWPKFSKYVRELGQTNSAFAQFECAADAVVTGDAAILQEMLHQNRALVHARSPREHRSMLLHYVSANGVEDYRQKTPKNAVEIAAILLDAGAEIDAVANAYGKGTTLGLTATSIHPLRAGVLIPLLELLLARGASVDGAPGGWNPVNACLANGRKLGSEFLANRGAKLDLEGASGVGRIELVKAFFNEDGSLNHNATETQLESGFIWACEYARAEVVDFLLQMGVDKNTYRQFKLTGLHWAAASGDINTVRALLRHGAPLEAKNVWGGTPLGAAIWATAESDPNDPVWPKADWAPIVELLLEAGANVDAVEYPTGNSRIDAVLHRHGAEGKGS